MVTVGEISQRDAVRLRDKRLPGVRPTAVGVCASAGLVAHERAMEQLARQFPLVAGSIRSVRLADRAWRP